MKHTAILHNHDLACDALSLILETWRAANCSLIRTSDGTAVFVETLVDDDDEEIRDTLLRHGADAVTSG